MTHSSPGDLLRPNPTFRGNWIHQRIPRFRALHSDESGVISLLTVFVMLGCTWLLLWVLNSARQLDSKVRLQTAADAAGQSGVGILARGMNAIAFANQLEAELFAAVAVMQAADQTEAANSPLLGLLPVFESILSGNGADHRSRPIPAFRQDVIHLIPPLAEELTRNVGRANGAWRGPGAASNPDGPQGPLRSMLWSSVGRPLDGGDESDPRSRTLPVLDPSPQGGDAPFLADPNSALEQARRERSRLARRYLDPWALDLAAGDQELANRLVAKAALPLDRLLNEIYPDTNLPVQLRTPSPDAVSLEKDLMFVAVTYRQHQQPIAPAMFSNPNARHAPAMAISQFHLFLPRDRYACCPWTETRVDPRTGDESTIVFTEGWPDEWSASSQNWHAKLVPVTASGLGVILSSTPSPSGGPSWGALSPRQLDELVHH
jgi:hypothetical protein